MNQIWLTIYIQNSGLPFLFGMAMTAVVMGMIIVFASTQPHQKSQDYGGAVGLNFAVFFYLGLIWNSRMVLIATLDYSASPPLFSLTVFSMELPLNISQSLLVILFLGIIVTFASYKWLRQFRSV